MSIMIVRHTVKDYANWRQAFDAYTPNRIAAGMTDSHVYRSAEPPNDVVVINTIADRERAKAFAGTEAIRVENIKAGVIGIPEVYFAD